MKILKIEDSKTKSQICEKTLRALPDWFGIESAILDYIQDVRKMETWAVMIGETLGFISLNKHNPYTAEIHVMGLLPELHGKGMGRKLVQTAEKSLAEQGFKYLTVKTLSERRPDKGYDLTRKFYLNYGFTPIEEFPNLWGPSNPCLMLIKNVESNFEKDRL